MATLAVTIGIGERIVAMPRKPPGESGAIWVWKRSSSMNHILCMPSIWNPGASESGR